MPTKVELQQQLLLADKKLAAESSALSSLIKDSGKIRNNIMRLKNAADVADESVQGQLAEKAGLLERTASDKMVEIDNVSRNIEALQSEIAGLEKEIENSPDRMNDELYLYERKVNEMKDDVPVLLMPVRTETRFHYTGTEQELWIRVYPDTLHAEIPRQYITATELKAVIDYLKNNTVDLVARVGRNRANFLLKWMQPYKGSNQFLHDLTKGDRQEIKDKYAIDVVDSKPLPRALTLPDRFVFRLYDAAGREARTEISDAVPGYVWMGFNNSNINDVGWMHNFDEALKLGMGIKIKLNEDEYRDGFSKLVVMGLKVGSDSQQSQWLLENLLQDHLYSENGLSVIKQGTITNNADDESTGYSPQNNWSGAASDPETSLISTGIKNTEEGSIAFTDGQWLTQFLGIDDNLLQQADNIQSTDQYNARAMNTALFPATLGYYLSELMDPLVSNEEIARVESFFTKYVLGRGTIPAVRVGKQPYGILPASDIDRLTLNASDPVRNTIAAKVQELFPTWKAKTAQVKRITNEAPVSTDDFIDILSLHPNSVSYKQRLMEDGGYKLNMVNAGLQSSGILKDLNVWMEQYYMEANGLGQKLEAVGLDANTQRPDILYKVFTTATKLEGPVIEPVKDENGNPLKETFSETQGLQFNYIQWLATSDFETIRNETGVPYDQKPLLYLFLRHAMLLRYTEAAKMLERTAYAVSAADIKAKYQDNQLVSSAGNSKTALLYRADERITGSGNVIVKDYIERALRESSMPMELLNLNNTRDALLAIANLSTAKLERAFAEHIDCCTYRIDAWINALYSVQLRKQRVINNDVWSKGIYLGAFAYLENLKPAYNVNSNGYILAPSLSHAASAAILRNAQLTYEGNEANPFNIDISSERTQRALQLLDGLRSGLALNELLGYRFERALHESMAKTGIGLDKYIYNYRIKYPLAQSQNTAENNGPQESISARNVVDGSKLLADFEAYSENIFRGITTVPEEKTAITAIVNQLQDVIDAVKDLTMAEGVYQAVFSNYDRGAAVLDSLNKGKFMPDLQVVNTPRTGSVLTHRVALHLNYKEPTRSTDSVRGKLEPSINEWLYSVLPDPNNVVVYVQKNANAAGEYISQKQLGVEPIDLLYLMNFDDTNAMTALDDLITGYLAGEKVHSIKYKKKDDVGKYTFYELATMIRPLRKLLFQSRYLSATDMKHTSHDPSNEVNRVWTSHRDRLNTVSGMLNTLDLSYFDNLTNRSLNDIRTNLSAVSKRINTLFDNRVSFGPVFVQLNRTDLTPAQITALKLEITSMVNIVKTKLSSQKNAITAIIAKLNAELARDPNAAPVYTFDKFMTELKATLGETVLMLPNFILPTSARDDYRKAFLDTDKILEFNTITLQKEFPVQDWVSGVARVREKAAALESVMNSVELVKNQRVFCLPIQLPYTANDRWMATQFTINNDGFTARDKLLYTIIAEDRQIDRGKNDNDVFCGFVIDDWTEIVPNKEEKAGLSFQYNRPNAEAPQTMLLMTPQEIRGNWKHEDMLSSIVSTFEVVKARAVEPDHLNGEISQFLPATIMFSPLYDTSVSTNLATNN